MFQDILTWFIGGYALAFGVVTAAAFIRGGR